MWPRFFPLNDGELGYSPLLDRLTLRIPVREHYATRETRCRRIGSRHFDVFSAELVISLRPAQTYPRYLAPGATYHRPPVFTQLLVPLPSSAAAGGQCAPHT